MNPLQVQESASVARIEVDSASPEAEDAFRDKTALIVVAHPDDEVLFAGSVLPMFRQITLLHTTDGAPSQKVARQRGFARRLDYARARRRELEAALAAGRVEATLNALPIRDCHAVFHVERIASEVAAAIARLQPDVILTHAYECGHMDHDTTALAVHAAAERVGVLDRLWEMACYHRRNGAIECGAFPHDTGATTIVIRPSPAMSARKRKMLDCFRTQAVAVHRLCPTEERFRHWSAQSLARRGSAERLLYGRTDSGIEHAIWRKLMTFTSRRSLAAPRHGVHERMLRWEMSVLLASGTWRRRHCRIAARIERLLARLPPPAPH